MGISSTDLMTSLEDIKITNESQKYETRGSSELGKEEFLNLLVTQLQNQDPLNPQDDTQFISQLAQFSSLEQMTNMSSTLTNTSAYSLIGKQVLVSQKNDAGVVSEVSGTVDYVEMSSGKAKVSVNGNLYDVENVVEVYGNLKTETESDESDNAEVKDSEKEENTI